MLANVIKTTFLNEKFLSKIKICTFVNIKFITILLTKQIY